MRGLPYSAENRQTEQDMLISDHSPTTFFDYLAVVRRRGFAIVAVTVLVAGVAYFLSSQQTKVYRGSAEVLLSRQSLSSALTGTQDPTLSSDPTRIATTQVGIARLPEVARRTLARAKVTGRTAADFLQSSNVHSNVDSDLLSFSVDDTDPAIAVRLATAYAQSFTSFSLELATATLKNARTELARRLNSLQATGDHSSALYRSLTDKVQQLRTMELLQDPGTVVKTAESASQVKPTPTRNGALGLLLGLLLGFVVAFLWEALDKRVRSESEIEKRLGLPLLSRLPTPARVRGDGMSLAMLDDPTGPDAEAIRKLRVNLEFANLDLNAQAIMITSAGQQEGKSTTVANLALALARSGRNVVLVDLDLRQPTLASLFGVDAQAGVTDVALGRASLSEAIVPVRLGPSSVVASMTNGRVRAGTLSLLPAGMLPPNPGEFVGTEALGRVIADLRATYEFILIDAPPMCIVGDAMALSTRIDAVIAVAKVATVSRGTLEELSRELRAISAAKLGLVLTAAGNRASYGEYQRYQTERPNKPEPTSRPRRSTASL